MNNTDHKLTAAWNIHLEDDLFYHGTDPAGMVGILRKSFIQASCHPQGVYTCRGAHDKVYRSGYDSGFVFELKATAKQAEENTKNRIVNPVPGFAISLPERRALNEVVFHPESLAVKAFITPLIFFGQFAKEIMAADEGDTQSMLHELRSGRTRKDTKLSSGALFQWGPGSRNVLQLQTQEDSQ